MDKKIEITIEVTIGKKVIKLTHDEAKELYRLLDTTPSIRTWPYIYPGYYTSSGYVAVANKSYPYQVSDGYVSNGTISNLNTGKQSSSTSKYVIGTLTTT